MDVSPNSLESLWDGLLSRQPELVRATYSTLDTEARVAILAHLQRIVSETGWHPEQRLSAQSALEALEGFEEKHE
jgi:hypothetical protein